MVIIQVMGGLGNQLQQYALYRKFVRMGVEARLDISWFEKSDKENGVTERELELPFFDRLIYETCTEEEKTALIGSNGLVGKLRRRLLPGSIRWFHEDKMYHPEIFGFENMYLSGYFACEKYYGDILYDLRDRLQFPQNDNPKNQRLSQEMHNCQSVSVHIRRGDYLSPENREMFGNICTDAYYGRALRFVRDEIPDAHFYVFSDDVSYVRKKYPGEEYTIVDINQGKDSFYDMWLMSQCKHNICANSTFSFWGARLNANEDKLMIRPTIHKNSQRFVKEEMEELWPFWRFVSPEGELV